MTGVDDERCRVTVVGTHKRVDVALTARAAIGEYAQAVALLCAEPADDPLPAAWSFGLPDGRLLPATSSLVAAGITDGQVLYLRDAAAGEPGEPVVRALAPAEKSSAPAALGLGNGGDAARVASPRIGRHLPQGVLVVVGAAALAGAASAAGFAVARVTIAQAAAVAALAGFVLLAGLSEDGWLAQRLADLLLPEGGTDGAERSGVISAVVILLSAMLAASLALAATSSNRFDLAAAGCLSAAAILLGATYSQAATAISVVTPGLAGLLVLALSAPRLLGGPGWLAVADLAVAGAAWLLAGVLAFWHGQWAGATAASRWLAAARAAAAACLLAAVPLTAGTFGVFGYFISLGRHA
jgi:hypothetical protein